MNNNIYTSSREQINGNNALLENKMNIESTEKKLILFGAGKRGRLALQRYKNKVACFCDNNSNIQGQYIDGVRIISFENMVKMYSSQYIIMITPQQYCYLVAQLEEEGIYDYIFFTDLEQKIIENEKQGNNAHNALLEEYVKLSSSEDLLDSTVRFTQLSNEIITRSKKEGFHLNYETYTEESTRYGNLFSLCDYAGVEYSMSEYLPLVSHVDSLPIYSAAFNYRTSVVFSGEYYIEQIHKHMPWVPVFSVGPFIHYSKGIYDAEKLLSTKERIGTMLLAFLPHTLENTRRGYDRYSFVDSLRTKYGQKYKTIWLCVYFADLNTDLYDYAEEKGIHIVTAGFRFDPKFDARLKTMFELADDVICGDMGTFVTYALYFKKNIGKMEINDDTSVFDMQFNNSLNLSIEKNKEYIEFEKGFDSLFSEIPQYREEQRRWLEPIAGYTQIKDKDYIRKIFEISKSIWELSEGKLRDYPSAVRKAYFQYNEKNDFEMMYILRKAVGSFLD